MEHNVHKPSQLYLKAENVKLCHQSERQNYSSVIYKNLCLSQLRSFVIFLTQRKRNLKIICFSFSANYMEQITIINHRRKK